MQTPISSASRLFYLKLAFLRVLCASVTVTVKRPEAKRALRNNERRQRQRQRQRRRRSVAVSQRESAGS